MTITPCDSLWQSYLETPSNIIYRDVALPIHVDDLEALDVGLDLFLGQVDGDLVATGTVHHLTHLIGEELAGQFDLILELTEK